MKRGSVILLCFLLLTCCAALAETESVELNHASSQLETAQKLAAPYEAEWDRFLNADEEAWNLARERGNALYAAAKGMKDQLVYQLEGDTSLEDCGPLSGMPSKVMTIDLNGYVLYAPTLGYGSFSFRNGTAVDVMTDTILEHEEGPIRLTVESDCCLLPDRNSAGLDLYAAGDFTLRNEGLVNGIRRMLYQAARSNKMVLENAGTIYSDGMAVTCRAFHQNTRATIRNDGVMVGLVRGLDFHCAGGTLDVGGNGSIIGAAGPDLAFPKITLNCTIIADDLNLTEEEKERIRSRLDPYGDKNVPTGIGLDLAAIQADYRITWKVTGEIWASQGILRAAFPQNDTYKGDLSPSVSDMSPSRDALITVELSKPHHSLEGDTAARELNEYLKLLKMDGFLNQGGELEITALSRYAEEDGKSHVRFSVGDTLWSRLTGRRSGKTYEWGEAENGTLDSQEPVSSLNAYYQMKACLSLVGNGGTILLDEDVVLPEGEQPISLPQGVELNGGDHALGGDVSLVVDKTATLSHLNCPEDPVCLKSALKVDTWLVLRGGYYRWLSLDNLMLDAEDVTIDTLEMQLWGGKKEYTTPIAKQLRLISTERITGAYRFLMDIGTAYPDEAAVDLTLMKGNQSKTFYFEGTTGASAVTVLVLNDRDPSQAFIPSGKDLTQTYTPYLKVINLRGLRTLSGQRPPLVFRDTDGTALYTFTQDDEGKWTLQEP